MLQRESIVQRERLCANQQCAVVIHVDRKCLNALFISLERYEQSHADAQRDPLAPPALSLRSEL